MEITNKNFSTTKKLYTDKPLYIKYENAQYENNLFHKDTNSHKKTGGLRTLEYFKETDNDLPLVSIVTVVYNGVKYLEKTIKSVLSQSYDNVEYIIIDGNSTDNTLEIIKKYSDSIDYWISEPDNGIYDAMNKGVIYSSGEIIKIINADDLMTEDSIQTAVKVYLEKKKSNEKEFFISSYLKIINKEDKEIALWKDKGFTKYFESFLHPTWYVPTKLYKKYGLYDLTYSISSDYEYFLRLKFNNVKMNMIEYPLSKYRVDGASSGFQGIFQIYDINKRYFNLLRAFYVMSLHSSLKVLGRIKRLFIKK